MKPEDNLDKFGFKNAELSLYVPVRPKPHKTICAHKKCHFTGTQSQMMKHDKLMHCTRGTKNHTLPQSWKLHLTKKEEKRDDTRIQELECAI